MTATRLTAAILLVLACGCGQSRAERARSDLRNLEKAVEAYYGRNQSWPESLEVLTDKEQTNVPVHVLPSALTDPWGKPYHYDPQQQNPDTRMPLLWTDGDPEQPAKISNWQP
jgi:hypothetical protein